MNKQQYQITTSTSNPNEQIGLTDQPTVVTSMGSSSKQPSPPGFQMFLTRCLQILSQTNMKSNLFKVLIAGALMIFSWNARAAVPIPPSITTQPADQNVSCHDTATFTVVATGSPPLSYIW